MFLRKLGARIQSHSCLRGAWFPLLAMIILGRVGYSGGLYEQGRLRETIRQLSAKEMAGRESGTPGGDRAARWLARQFEDLGASPLFQQESFLQRFPLRLETRPGDRNLLTFRGRGFLLGEDFAPFPFSARGDGTGILYWVGTGVDLPPEQELEGRIALMTEERSPVPPVRVRVEALRRGGAKAVLVIPRPRRGGERLSTKGVGLAGARSHVPVICLAQDRAEEILLREGVRLRELKRSGVRGLRGEIRFRVDLTQRQGEGWNVGARIPGRIPGGKPVLIGAHYDHLGMGGLTSRIPGRPPGEVNVLHPGADDNASGVAALLEIARDLLENPARRDVLVLGFGAEEPGMIGSRFFLLQWKQGAELPGAMLNLDMVGRLRNRRLQVIGVDSSPGLRDLTRKALKAQGLRAQFQGDGFGPSDQTPFYSRGIPVLYFFTGYHSEYHRPTDTWKRINYPGLARVARTAGDLIRQLGDLEVPLARAR